MLKFANLANGDATGSRFGLGNENLPRLRGKNVIGVCSVHQAGQFRCEQLFPAAGRSGNQIGVREPIFLMRPLQIFQCCCAGKGHLMISDFGFQIADW